MAGSDTGRPAAWRTLGRGAAIAAALLPAPALLATGTAGASVVRATSGSIQGTVVAVDAAAHAFTVRTASGSKVTVKVTSATAYKDSSIASPTFADVKVGRSVAVIGSAANAVDTAAIVIIGGPGPLGAPGGPPGAGFGGHGGFRPGVFGTVRSVDPARHTFELRTATGSVTVDVLSSTAFRDRGRTRATFSSLQVGAQVAVVGTRSGDVEKAKLVILGGFRGPGGLRPGVLGRVASVDAARHTFVVVTASGSVTVEVSSSTVFRDRGATTAAFADVKVGLQVAVAGTKAKGREKATSVFIGLGAPAGA